MTCTGTVIPSKKVTLLPPGPPGAWVPLHTHFLFDLLLSATWEASAPLSAIPLGRSNTLWEVGCSAGALSGRFLHLYR